MTFPKDLVNKTKGVWNTDTELHKAMDEENWIKVLKLLPPARLQDTSEKVNVGAEWMIFALENELVKVPEETAKKIINRIDTFLESDINLSKIVNGKIIKKVEHIDKDACIQITFSDESYIVVEGVPDKEFKAIPLFHYYQSSW